MRMTWTFSIARTLTWFGVVLLTPMVPAWAGHAYAQFGDVRYPAGFSHFSYVRPDAPKGGQITLVAPTRVTQFDKFNPFTLKGNAPPGMSALLFESLLTPSLDEPTTAYGLLAQDVQVAPDGLSVRFVLHPQARFQDGQPVRAQDVRHSFERLTSAQAAPQWRTLLAEVASVQVLGEREVRFSFKRANAELPLMVGGMPVFSERWGQGKPFDQVLTEPPIVSGPYRLGPMDFGRDITYVRNPDYWARDLNVRRGQFNFDRITYKLYRDNTAQLEAFKAGEFDYLQSFVAREWARSFTGRAFESGEIIKRELPHRNAGDFQGFIFNTRKAKLADVRVRKAIELAMDFEWLNRQLFYNAYTRVQGYFVGSDFEARDLPGPDEWALLKPLEDRLPPQVFTDPVPLAPRVSLDPDSGQTLRDHLRVARTLLAEAGWTYRDGALRNARGEALTLEFLDSSGSMGRIVTPYAKQLAKLGIAVNYRVVDFALLQKRMDVFDFDVISNRYVGSEAPGNELLERFGSRAASTEGSSNLMGLKNPAVDRLLEQVISSRTRPQLITALRALDRVLRHGHYMVPHWYSRVHRVAWRQHRFAQPATLPLYYQPETWATQTWWALTTEHSGAQ